MTSPSVVLGVDLKETERVYRICVQISASYNYPRLILAHTIIIRTASTHIIMFDFRAIELYKQQPKAICAITSTVCQCCATAAFRDLPDIS